MRAFAIAHPVSNAIDRPRVADLGLPMRAFRVRLFAALLAVDVACCIAAFLAANFVRHSDPLHEQGLRMIVLFAPIFAAINVNRGGYTVDVLKSPRVGARKAVQSLLATASVLVLILFALKVGAEFSRAIFAIGTFTSILLIILCRTALGQAIGTLFRWSFTNDVMLVDEVPPPANSGQRVLVAQELGLRPTTRDPVMLDRLGGLLRNCDRLILACPPERRASWLGMFKGSDIDVEVIAPELVGLGAMQIRRSGDLLTVLVCCGPLAVFDRLLKRALDLAVASFLLALFLPVMLTVAIIIKLESKGPVFFRQHRVGLGNRIFTVLKFRTMRITDCDPRADRLTEAGDRRVTRVGRILRKTSLDELPQFLNVLAGSMSVVGPRPHALGATAENLLYWDIDERYWARHAVKPGMTGLAQVRGYRGSTNVRADLQRRLHADLEYLSGWTIWRDINIIMRTTRVLVHRNAF